MQGKTVLEKTRLVMIVILHHACFIGRQCRAGNECLFVHLGGDDRPSRPNRNEQATTKDQSEIAKQTKAEENPLA